MCKNKVPLTSNIRTENRVFSLGNLRGKTHDKLFKAGIRQDALIRSEQKLKHFIYKTFPQSPSTYHSVPPGGTEANAIVATGRLEEVALGVSPVQTRRDHRVAKAEGRRLEDMTNARVDVRLVAAVGRHRLIKQRLQVLVEDYVLQRRKRRWL